MRAEQLHGMAVVSVQRAERLGRIEDVFIDLRKHRLAALLLQGGLFRGGPVVPWEEVRSIGQDAVMADDQRAAPEGRSEDYGVRLSNLRGTKVVSDAGSLVGTIASADIDPATGQVTGYAIAAPEGGGLLRGAPQFLLPSEAVVAVGADLITVEASALDSRSADASSDQGGESTR